MNRKALFKAYYITCSLLSDFTGICSMVAEEDMFNWALDFVKGKITEKKFAEDIEFQFGLTLRHIRKAVKRYEHYREDNITFGIG